MRVIPHTTPIPKIISSVVPDRATEQTLSASIEEPSKFASTLRVIFSITLAASCLAMLPFVYLKYQSSKNPSALAPGLIAVQTKDGNTLPLSASMFHVTAISLGNPPLAVVNGRNVAVGDHISVNSSRPNAVVKVEVASIADGQVQFAYGDQSLTARLEPPSLTKPKRR